MARQPAPDPALDLSRQAVRLSETVVQPPGVGCIESGRGSMMGKALFTAGALALAAVLGTIQADDARAQDVTLEFVVWNYSLETIQDNVAKFEAENPGIKVNVTDYTWPDYHDTMVLRLRGDTQTDVIYAGQDWLPSWASAGWLVPLEEYFPEVTQYEEKTTDYALSDMTYNDQLYGLSYYADIISFVYNKKILDEHGIEVPQTWDDVLAASLKLKEAGMEKPIVYEYNQELPNFYDAFVAQVYGRGGDMFDADLNPLFNDPESEAFKQLQWLQDAFTKHGIVAPETHESKVIPAMNTGKHAFTVVFNYVLAAMNNAADQPRAGEFAMAPMPGEAPCHAGLCQVLRDHRAGGGRPRQARCGLEVHRVHGRRRLSGGRALGGREGPGLCRSCRCSTIPTSRRRGRPGSTWTASRTRRRGPRTAPGPNGPGSGAPTSGRCWPRPWSARRASQEVMDAGAAKWLEYRQLLRGN